MWTLNLNSDEIIFPKEEIFSPSVARVPTPPNSVMFSSAVRPEEAGPVLPVEVVMAFSDSATNPHDGTTPQNPLPIFGFRPIVRLKTKKVPQREGIE